MNSTNLINLIVRHNKSRAVVARCSRGPAGGIRLDAVAPKDGPSPEVSHLLGEEFPDERTLRAALVAAMKGPVGDTLDNVRLSPTAYAAWQETVMRAVMAMKSQGRSVNADAIPDEMAAAMADGQLKIWVDVPGWRRVELFVPSDQWEWKTRPN